MKVGPKNRRGALFLGLAALGACSEPLGMDGERRTAYMAVDSRDAKLTGARIHGDAVVRGSRTLGRVFVGSRAAEAWRDTVGRRAPVTGRDEEEDERVICLVEIIFRRDNGEIISVTVLKCSRPGGRGSCDREERRIIAEYDDPRWPVTDRRTPTCDDLEHNGGGTAHFSWAELNGYFQRGNPHTGYGWVQESLKSGLESLRAAWGRSPVRRANRYTAALPVTSGYRCPHGNTQVGGDDSSWHLEGRAADISTKRIAGIGPNYGGMTPAQRALIEDLYSEISRLALQLGATDLQGFREYDDRHFHVAWE